MRRNVLMIAAAGGLSACGGAGVESVGSTAVTTAGGTTAAAATDIYSQFTQPVDAKTYSGVGGTQSFSYSSDSRGCCGQQAQLYASNASTVRSSTISIAYDPRDAIFTLVVADPLSNTSTSTRFQDPGSRTDFAGAKTPQFGTPDFSKLPAGAVANPNILYLQAGDGNPLSPYQMSGSGFVNPGNATTPPDGTVGSSYTATTLFYEKPGSTTKYVTFAGFVRNSVSFGSFTLNDNTYNDATWHLERGAFAYGALTANTAVPTSGTGSYSGEMLGTMVYNPTLDDKSPLPTYFQWLTGTSKVTVDFGTKAVGLQLAGTVLAPQLDRYTTPQTAFVTEGSSFAASGTATIDLVSKGGFAGSFAGGSFTFTAPGGGTFANGSRTASVAVAGSSIDGAFYGPNAEEVGGGFHVVGGVPDQRVDILGAFTAKK